MLHNSFRKVCITCANKKHCSYKQIFDKLETYIDRITETQDGISGINFDISVSTECDCYSTLKEV